jgi:hypothetical protein
VIPLRLRGAVIVLAVAACGPITKEPASSEPECSVDAFKELLVVDESVLSDSAAMNSGDGALGFRHLMTQLVPAEDDASAATLGWLGEWAPLSLRCQWLRDRPENGCDATCESCYERRLDLSRAPFRLLAVANRIDLAEEMEDGAGEARLVFAATAGPADDPRSRPLPVSVIFEFRLAGERKDWARQWHALGAHRAFDAAYTRDLTELTGSFVHVENLGQVRILDAGSSEVASMHEFHFDRAAAPEARFVRAGLRRTPSHALDGTPELRDFVAANDANIMADRYEVPASMLGDRIRLGEKWTLSGTAEPLRHAFAASTCDGCHGSEHPTNEGGFHISPFDRGTAKLSRFLFDPDHRADDELSRRATFLGRLACAE